MSDRNTIPTMLDLRRWTATLSGASLPKISIRSMLKNREIGRRRKPTNRRLSFMPNISNSFTLSEKAKLVNRFLPNEWKLITMTNSELFRCSHVQDEGFVTLDKAKILRFYAEEQSEYELMNSFHLVNTEGAINDLARSTRGDQLAYVTSNAYLYHCVIDQIEDNLNWREFYTTPLPMIKGWESYFSLCYTLDDEYVIVGGSGGYISIIGTSQYSHYSFSAHHGNVKAIYCSKADTYFFCSGSVDGYCKLWDGRALHNNIPIAISDGDGYCINYIDGDSYNRYIVTTSVGGGITIWDLRRFSENPLFNVQREEMNQHREREYFDTALKMNVQNTLEIFWRAKFSPKRTGHRYIYCGSSIGYIYIFDIMTGEIIRSFRKCRREIHDCSWHPNDNEIISTALCGATCRWYYGEKENDDIY